MWHDNTPFLKPDFKLKGCPIFIESTEASAFLNITSMVGKGKEYVSDVDKRSY